MQKLAKLILVFGFSTKLIIWIEEALQSMTLAESPSIRV